MNTDDKLFTTLPVRKAYMKFALPVVFGMVVTLVYNMVDTYFIAHTGNTALVAGVSLCAPIFTLMIALGDILGLGGSSLISRRFGMQREGDGRRISAFCFYGALAEGVVITVLLLLFRQQVLGLLGATVETLPYASQYYTCLVLGAPLAILSLTPNNQLRTEGLSRESMIGSVLGSVVNMILDPLFIFTLHMGAAGAAAATVIGYLCTDLYFLYVLLKKSRRLSVRISDARIDRTELSDMLAIGIPASVTNMMQSFCIMLTNRFLLPYGTQRIAAMGIVMKINMITVLVLVGFSFGPQPLIGYNYGAGNRQRLKEILSFAYRFECSLAAAFAVLLSVFAGPLIRLFMNDPEIVALGIPMLRCQQIGMIFIAVVLVTTCTFQSAGKALGALFLSISRQGVIFAVALFALSHMFGYPGVLCAQAVSDCLTALLAVILFFDAEHSLIH